MKKLALILAGVMMALSLAACAPKPSEEVAEGGPMPGGEFQVQETEDPRLEKLADSAGPGMEVVVFYTFNEDGKTIRSDIVEVEVLNEVSVVELLIQEGFLEEGTVINNFEITGGEKAGPGVDRAVVDSGERVGHLDLSQMPTDAEAVVLAAVANMFCENFELDKLELLVNGQLYESEFIMDGYLAYDKSFIKERK